MTNLDSDPPTFERLDYIVATVAAILIVAAIYAAIHLL